MQCNIFLTVKLKALERLTGVSIHVTFTTFNLQVGPRVRSKVERVARRNFVAHSLDIFIFDIFGYLMLLVGLSRQEHGRIEFFEHRHDFAHIY